MRQQAMLQQQQQNALFPQPTGYGSNNPFAPRQAQPQQTSLFPSEPTPSFVPVPVVSQQQEQPAQAAASAAPQQTSRPFQPAPPKDDGQFSGLANLLARGREDGLDTFGNTGAMRKLGIRSVPDHLQRVDRSQESPLARASIRATAWPCRRQGLARTTLSVKLNRLSKHREMINPSFPFRDQRFAFGMFDTTFVSVPYVDLPTVLVLQMPYHTNRRLLSAALKRHNSTTVQHKMSKVLPLYTHKAAMDGP